MTSETPPPQILIQAENQFQIEEPGQQSSKLKILVSIAASTIAVIILAVLAVRLSLC